MRLCQQSQRRSRRQSHCGKARVDPPPAPTMPADAGPAGGATTVPRDPTQSHGTNALLSALALVSDERYSGQVKAPVVSRENSSHALRRISSHEQLAQTARHRVPFSALNLRGFSPRAAPCAASKPTKTCASSVGRRRRRARVPARPHA